MSVKLDLPLSQWPIFYIDGEPYIYDDTPLFFDENGEPLGQHFRHSNLAIYLHTMLHWMYRATVCTITFDLYLKAEIEMALAAAADAAGVVQASARVSPDVSLIKNVTHPDKATYIVDVDGPPPNVVFEIASESTYSHDLNQKFQLYAAAYRTKEYFAYDPHDPRLWSGSRLKAWRLVRGRYVEIKPDQRGWVWSRELDSWLVEDNENLWLYDRNGNKRLSPQEEAEQEKQRADQAEGRLEQETQRAEQEKLRAEQAEARIARLEEELRRRNSNS